MKKNIFEQLFESAPDAIIVADREGLIQRVNNQAETLFGYARSEMLGRPVELLLPDRYRGEHSQHRENYYHAPRVRTMGEGLDLFARHRDGTEFPVDIMLSPIGEEEPVVLAVVRDITDRKRFDQELREKHTELERAVLAKDHFLASMSHELRTPLNAIIGFASTLLMKLPGPLSPEQEKQVEIIKTSGRHLLSIINNLLDLTKIDSGQVQLNFEPVVCQSVVQEVQNILRPSIERKNLQFAVEQPERELIAHTDRRALTQILLNLAGNALKFTDRGSINIVLQPAAHAGTEIAVIDTGIGIKKGDREKLFRAFSQIDPSSTRRYEGTGLGLHLSQKLAELIGGRIEVESSFGQGSKFSLILNGKEKPS